MNKPTGRQHITSLDGLRGTAILMVFFLHTIILPQSGYTFIKDLAALGHLGVDLFFVLSGFLITGILYAAKGHSHYFRNFYARRAVRIFPLYYLFLAIYYFLVVRFHVVNFGADKALEAGRDLHWAWFYGINLQIARQGHFITASLNHFWTLAIEEHFYCMWPFLVYWLSRRRLLIASGLLTIGCLLLRIALQAHGTSGMVITTFTLCRVDSFALGGAASLLIGIPHWRERLGKLAPVLLGLCLPLVLVTYFAWNQILYPSIGFTAASFFFTLLIVYVVLNEQSKAAGLFRSAPLRFLGKYSYSLYVFHWPIQIAVNRKFPIAMLSQHTHSLALAVLLNMVLVAVPSLAIALTTWNLYEKHFLALKRFFPEPRSIVSKALETDSTPAVHTIG